MLSQTRDQLRIVGDDRHALACRCHDLLAQQCATVSFDEVERTGKEFIGAVNGEVNLGVLGESGERDFLGASLLGSAVRSGYSEDAQTFLRHPTSNGRDR